jgi:hypothetical protein
VTAPEIESFGAALDMKFTSRTYVGLIGEVLDSEVNRMLGVFGYPNAFSVGYPSSTPQDLHYREYSAAAVANQLMARDWALGLSYRFSRAELEQTLPEVPLSIFTGARASDTSDLHTVSAYALYSHPCGFFARAELNWYWQDNETRTYDASGVGTTSKLPDDNFAQVNLWAGYRFRRGLGDVSVGVLNVNDTDYQLNPLNVYAELPRERVVAARIRLRF